MYIVQWYSESFEGWLDYKKCITKWGARRLACRMLCKSMSVPKWRVSDASFVVPQPILTIEKKDG